MPAATSDSFGLRMSGIQMIWVWQRNAELTWKDMKRYEKKKSGQVSIRCFCEIPVGPKSAYSVICQFVVWIKSIRPASKGVYRIEPRCGKVTLDVRSRDGLEKARDS